jgi:PDDEXK-like domain of unknown function (DUF3799)
MTVTIGQAAASVVRSLEKVSAPGVYDLPIEIYHGDCCIGPSISSSGLRTIEAVSPLHYWWSSPLNPKGEKREASKALDFGRATHCLLLGDPVFRSRFAVRPDEWADWRASAAKQWKEGKEAEGLTVVTPDDVETIKRMAESLDDDPLARGLILQGHGAVEKSLIWQDAETGMWLKSRPDILLTGGNAAMTVDLKTTADASDRALERTMAEYGYHMQGALAGEAMRRVLNADPGNDGTVLIFVEKTAPYAVNVKVIDAEALDFGMRLCRRALRTFAEGIKTGVWRGYRGNGSSLSLPAWITKQLREEDEAGLLAA